MIARVAGQRIDQHLLGMAVGDPSGGRAGLAGKATRLPQRLPVRRAVARAGEPALIHERLGEQNWMVMRRAEIVGQTAKAQPQHPRGQVRHGASGQDEEPSVVGDEVKAAKLLLGQPTDPPVTGLELERTSVPADEREPELAEHRDVAHASPHQPPERQIVEPLAKL